MHAGGPALGGDAAGQALEIGPCALVLVGHEVGKFIHHDDVVGDVAPTLAPAGRRV